MNKLQTWQAARLINFMMRAHMDNFGPLVHFFANEYVHFVWAVNEGNNNG
jgi:hypothetical protein